MAYPFENLPLQPPDAPPDDFWVYAIVEQPRGTNERTVWDEHQREFVKTGLTMAVPLPAPYGWIPQTICEGDGDALDVLILSEAELPQGEYLAVRPVGVLLRQDNDHKVLAVDVQDEDAGAILDYRQLPPEVINFIEEWFRPYFALNGWLDAAGARAMIEADHQKYLANG